MNCPHCEAVKEVVDSLCVDCENQIAGLTMRKKPMGYGGSNWATAIRKDQIDFSNISMEDSMKQIGGD